MSNPGNTKRKAIGAMEAQHGLHLELGSEFGNWGYKKKKVVLQGFGFGLGLGFGFGFGFERKFWDLCDVGRCVGV